MSIGRGDALAALEELAVDISGGEPSSQCRAEPKTRRSGARTLAQAAFAGSG